MTQRRAVKVAGVLYLVTLATASFAEFHVRARLIAPHDAAHTAVRIVSAEGLFRLGAVSDLITFATDAGLVVALYLVLNPVHRGLALLAAFWRLTECSILATITLNDFVALRFFHGAGYLQAFQPQQLQALAQLFLAVEADGYRIGGVFFGLGSTVFAYLWLKSRYVPRILAAWGIIASLVPVVVPMSYMLFPRLETAWGPLRRARSGGPIVIFEIALGVWLLLRGIRTPVEQ